MVNRKHISKDERIIQHKVTLSQYDILLVLHRQNIEHELLVLESHRQMLVDPYGACHNTSYIPNPNHKDMVLPLFHQTQTSWLVVCFPFSSWRQTVVMNVGGRLMARAKILPAADHTAEISGTHSHVNITNIVSRSRGERNKLFVVVERPSSSCRRF